MTEIFPLILAGHLIGDFLFQTDWDALNKETNWWADLHHSLTYTLGMALCVLPAWHTQAAFWFLGISLVTHALIDRRWPTRLVMRKTYSRGFSEVFWGVIATDQVLHLSILCIAYSLLQG